MTLSKFEGHRGVVLVFFSVNCPACIAKVPDIMDFVEQSREKNIVVFGVNLGDPKVVIDAFVNHFDPNYRILMDPLDSSGSTYNIYTIPHIVAIDADGIVRYRHTNLPRDREGLIAELTAPLDAKEETVETVESEPGAGSTGGAHDEVADAGEEDDVVPE
jgi:peroxiredoxin